MTSEKIAEFAGNVRTRDDVIEAIKSAVAAEREACAKIAEARASEGETGTWQANEGLVIASYIRERSNEQ